MPLLIFSGEEWALSSVRARTHLLQSSVSCLNFLPVSQNEIYFILATSEQTCVYIFPEKLDCPYGFLNQLSDQVQKYVNCCVVGLGSSRTYHSEEEYPIL